MIAVAAGLALIGFADHALRRGRIERLILVTKYGFFELRDELRREAIARNATEWSWFKYMDTTLTRTIKTLDYMSLIGVLSLGRRYRTDELWRVAERRDEAFRAPENAWIREVYDGYGRILFNFIMKRNPWLNRILIPFLRIAPNSPANQRESDTRTEIIETVANTPPASTLARYAGVAA